MTSGVYKRIPAEERFWSKVKKTLLGCWEWQACLDDGYGVFTNAGKTTAHRFSWELHFGPIPKNTEVLHKCDNRRCVRPSHLFLGTKTDNRKDCVQKGRQAKGEGHGKATLTEAIIKEVKKKMETQSVASLAREHQVGYDALYKAVTGKQWKHLSCN